MEAIFASTKKSRNKFKISSQKMRRHEASDIIVRFIEIERVPICKKTIDSHIANETLFINPNNTVVEYFQANLQSNSSKHGNMP